MKQGISFLLVLCLCTACRQTAFQKSLSRADEVTIQFYNNSRSDSVYKIVKTNNPDAIAQLAGYITGKTVSGSGCGRDGLAVFKKGDTKIAAVGFSLTGCKVFEYTERSVPKRTVLSKEAFDFLAALKLERKYD